MGVRLHEPNAFCTAAVGRIYLIRYLVPTTVDVERRILADYERHRDSVGGHSLNLAIFQHPAMPLPPVDVRAFWRASMSAGSGVEAVATVFGGVGGASAAAVTSLLQHLFDPTLRIRVRVFTSAAPALEWFEEFGTHTTRAEANAELAALVQLP